MSFTIKELQETSDEKLIELHDKLSKTTCVGVQYYLDEIHRRDSERTNRTMRVVAYCSLAVAIISLVVAILSLFK